MSKKKFNSWMKTVRKMNYNKKADYIFIRDFDNARCISYRKEKTLLKYNKLDIEKIYFVVQEIESWYLSIINKDGFKHLKINECSNTDNITKEIFHQYMRKSNFKNALDFQIEILKFFDLKKGIKKNRSLKYFCNKFLLAKC